MIQFCSPALASSPWNLSGSSLTSQGSPQPFRGHLSSFFSHSFASGKTGLDFLPLLTHYLTPLLSDCYLITPGPLSESPWLAPFRCLLSLPPPPPFWCVIWADSVSLASTPPCLFLWCDLSLPHVAPAARSRSPPPPSAIVLSKNGLHRLRYLNGCLPLGGTV